jgi:3-methyladenine DNA glycosylase AlkD
MNATEVMAELKKKGSAQTRKIYGRHGCPEPFFGVKVADLKGLVKKIKSNTPLAKELYGTGNSDAMYLAGLIGNGAELTRAELKAWADRASWYMISRYTVPWMVCEHPEAWEIGLEWIESKDERISSSGWSVLSILVGYREDGDLDLKAVEKLLDRVVKSIGAAPNQTRYSMNGFVIAVGGSVKSLTKKALAAAEKIGKVTCDLGDTDCKVPLAADYIRHIISMGRHGKKRAMLKC